MTSADDNRSLPVPVLVLRLRALVLALGECVRPTWWKTEFMSETGLRYLERLYPRTSFQAAVHAAGKAACDAHDKAAGRVGVYHLFRLPEALEADMNHVSTNTDEGFVLSFRAALGHQEKLLELLATVTSGVAATETTTGAKRIGNDTDLMTLVGIEKTAGVYHHAFAHGNQSFPYFTADESGGRG